MNDTMVAVPLEVLRSAWVALVPTIQHATRTCNGGPQGGPWCFTCDAIVALQRYQKLWVDQ